MKLSTIVKLPLSALAVLSKEKSFVKNPVIGSYRLNRYGLHLKRLSAAHAMAQIRRQQLARSTLLTADQRASFDQNGYILIRDFLPIAEFNRLKSEVLENTFQAREMRQGQTVTRMTPAGASVLNQYSAIARFYNNPLLLAMFHYVSSWKGSPINFIETVIADAGHPAPDPQTELHGDTFHPSGKFWFYLHDVEADGGPLQFVPGSHRLTPARMNWEYSNSLSATSCGKSHHSYGSFRVNEAELASLGYQQPVKMVVPQNTLVIADTYGFHARTVSQKNTVRIALHGYLRRNPFLPWPGLDLTALPVISGRQLDLFFRYTDLQEKFFNKRGIWRDVGRCRPTDPAHI